MTRIIEIIVSPQGETLVETRGFAGSECRDASRFIEQALGRPHSEVLTADFHQRLDQSIASQEAHHHGAG